MNIRYKIFLIGCFLYSYCFLQNLYCPRPADSTPASKCYECQKCLSELQALKKENHELKASEKSYREETMKYMKMFFDAKEDAINIAAKWIAIATDLANKIIGHSVRMSKL